MSRNSRAATQRGVSMIEVLVTLFVVAVGLLGVAGLQLLSLQTHHGAYTRTQATNIAYALSDVARANRSAVLSGGVSDDVLEGWVSRSEDMIVGVDVGLEVVNAATGEVRISVSWLDDRADDAPDDGMASFVLTTRI